MPQLVTMALFMLARRAAKNLESLENLLKTYGFGEIRLSKHLMDHFVIGDNERLAIPAANLKTANLWGASPPGSLDAASDALCSDPAGW